MQFIGQEKKIRTRSNRGNFSHGNMQCLKYTCFAQKTYPLLERLVVELNLETGKQFLRVRLGFSVNKRTDIRFVVAR